MNAECKIEAIGSRQSAIGDATVGGGVLDAPLLLVCISLFMIL